jgi:CheY-like chemotaxis protein
VHVLVVDDEPDARRMVSAVLARCNAIVTTAGSVAEALGHLEQVVPDVLLSDIGMPEEDGYSLIRRVRQRPAGQGGTVPAAALTAYTRVEDSARVLEAGFQMFLPKPVEPAVLLDAVAKLVKRENLGAETAGSPAR